MSEMRFRRLKPEEKSGKRGATYRKRFYEAHVATHRLAIPIIFVHPRCQAAQAYVRARFERWLEGVYNRGMRDGVYGELVGPQIRNIEGGKAVLFYAEYVMLPEDPPAPLVQESVPKPKR